MIEKPPPKPDQTPDLDSNGLRWHALLAMLFTAQLLVVCNILLIPPLLPFMTDDLSLTKGQVTLLLASFPAVALVTNFLLGPTADRAGVLRFFRVGLLLVTVCFLASAFAPTGTALIAMRLISGLAFPMIGMTTYALAAENSHGASGSQMIARISSTASFGPLVMLPFGMLFADALSWRAVFLVLAGSSLAILLASYALRDLKGGARPVRATTDARASLVANPAIRPALIAYFLQSLGFFTIVAVFPTFVATAYDDTAQRIAIFTIGGVSGLIGAGLIGRVFHGRSQLTLAGWAVTATVPVALVLPGAIAWFVLICLAWAAFSLLRQTIVALLMGHGNFASPPDQRATFNSLMNVAFQLGSLTGAFAAGQFYFYDPSFWTVATTGASAFFVSALALRRHSLADSFSSTNKE